MQSKPGLTQREAAECAELPTVVLVLGRDSLFPQVYETRVRETFQTDQYQATSKTIIPHRNALQ